MSVTTSRTDITVLTLSYSFYFGTRPLDILHNNRNSSGRCRIKHPLSLSSKSRRHKNLGNLKTNIILTSFCIFGLLSHYFTFQRWRIIPRHQRCLAIKKRNKNAIQLILCLFVLCESWIMSTAFLAQSAGRFHLADPSPTFVIFWLSPFQL